MTATLLHFPPMARKSTDPTPNRIREHRKKAGFTQEELAHRTGTSYVQMSRLETGARPLTMSWLVKIGDVLGVPPGELMSIADNPYALSEDERRLIDAVRATGGTTIEAVTNVAETMRGFHGAPAVLEFPSKRKSA